MDVYGKQAKTEKGEYFRNNVWWWHPLWDYCCSVSFVAQQVENGHNNSGDGLGAEDAKLLAETLRAEIDAGRTLQYETEYMASLKAMPDEPCTYCDATGTRHDKFVQGTCNACAGKGKRRPFATSYPFSVENVREFAEFLEDCGGFEIC
jgi:DnaJ-class molecular chaperone